MKHRFKLLLLGLVGVLISACAIQGDPCAPTFSAGPALKAHHLAMHLGKSKTVHHSPLKFAAYFRASQLPPIPQVIKWNTAVADSAWTMMGNDNVGDCTCAAFGHELMGWSSLTQPAVVTPSTSEVLAVYSAVTGYDPVTGAHDDGAIEQDVLQYLQTHGMSVGGVTHKLDSFAEVNPHSHDEIRACLYLFGTVYTGISLPAAWQGATDWVSNCGLAQGIWAPGSWGGHAVPIIACDADWLYVISWGQIYRLSWSAWDTYGDEAWAPVTTDWIAANGKSPSGFDLPALQADSRVLNASATPARAPRSHGVVELGSNGRASNSSWWVWTHDSNGNLITHFPDLFPTNR